MKTLIPSILCLAGVIGNVLASDDRAAELTTITTLSGKSYRDVKILKAYPDGLAFRHANGAAQISFTDLPESLRTQFNYSPEEAKSYVKAHLEAERAAAEKKALARAERRKKQEEVKLAGLQLAMLRQQAQANSGGYVGYADYGVPTWGYGYAGGDDFLPPLGESVAWDGRRPFHGYGYGYGGGLNRLFYNYNTTSYIGPYSALYSGCITNSNVRPTLTFGGYRYPTALACPANCFSPRVLGHGSRHVVSGGIGRGHAAPRHRAFVPANSAGARIGGTGGLMQVGSPRISHR